MDPRLRSLQWTRRTKIFRYCIVPLFLCHRVLLLHIPKCGGDTFSHALRKAGDPPFLFVADGSVLTNGHTPQHMTWRELCQAGWNTPPDFRVIAFVRHPVERVLSAYRYIHLARPDLVHMAKNPAQFMDYFFSRDATLRKRFDHHNMAIIEFLKDAEGNIEESIEIHHISEMNAVLESLGLSGVAENERRNVTSVNADFQPRHLRRIRKTMEADIAWFEARFPQFQEFSNDGVQR